jgi:uncharacterized protein
MLVVSDTSPVSALLQIGRAHLLKDLFDRVCIPPAVNDELARFHDSLPSFVEVRLVSDQSLVKALLTKLDLGEAEAIVLAQECNADFLLIDERRGRKAATEAGVQIIGLIGVILLAKSRGLILTVKELIGELQSKAGFYVDDVLLNKTLQAAGE